MDDLRVLLPQLDRQRVFKRVQRDASAFRAGPRLLEAAEHNWYVLTGEPLPPAKIA